MLFFSMATRFDRAALGTDAVSKDVELVIGTGVALQQAELMFELLQQDERLLQFYINSSL